MTLEEVLEIIIPEGADSMNTDGSEADFVYHIWEEIKVAKNQVHLYSLLMNAIIGWAKLFQDTPFLQHTDDLRFLKETVYEEKIVLEDSILPIRIEMAVDLEELNAGLLNKMQKLWSILLDKELSDDQQEFKRDQVKDELIAQEDELRNQLFIDIGIKGKIKEGIIATFVEDLALGNISEDVEPLRTFRLKLLQQISNRIAISPINLNEQYKLIWIKFRDLSFTENQSAEYNETTDEQRAKEIEQPIRDIFHDIIAKTTGYNLVDVNEDKRDRLSLIIPIIHFYANEKNFKQYIINDDSEINLDSYTNLLQLVLNILLDNINFELDYVFRHAIAFMRSQTKELYQYDAFILNYPIFEIENDHIEKLILSLITETESALRHLSFNFANEWLKVRPLLKKHLPVVKLQSVEIISYVDLEVPNTAFSNDKVLISGYYPLAYYQLDDKDERYLGSFDGCKHFFVSQTGMDQIVFNDDFTYKYDFFNKVPFSRKDDEFVKITHIGRTTRTLPLMRKALKSGLSPKNEFAENFVFGNKKWIGFYHLGIEKKDVLSFQTNVITQRSGGGYGTGRADIVDNDEYRWRCSGNVEKQKKIAKWLKLEWSNFIDENYSIEKLPSAGSFIHEFAVHIDDNNIRYVRVNLPYVNTVEVKKMVEDDDAIGLLNSLDIEYYRKVEDNFVIKKDRKNYPFGDINLPVCFAIPENYRLLHKFSETKGGGDTGRKWLMRVQREKALLAGPTGLKADLNRIKDGYSATDYARMRLNENQFDEQDIWQQIKSPFESLPTLQEWCHLHGRGDGGPDESNNLVAGSKHCNTEQAAIELAQRLVTQNSATEYYLRTTGYVFQEITPDSYTKIIGSTKKTPTDRNIVISKVSPTSGHPIKRKRKDDDETIGASHKRKQNSGSYEVPDSSLAAFIRYRVYKSERGRISHDDAKLIDYTFEGQSEFFDMNQYRIVNSIVEHTLKGNAEPWKDEV